MCFFLDSPSEREVATEEPGHEQKKNPDELVYALQA